MAAIAPSRRDFVAMLLGAPLAVSCGSKTARIPPGNLVETGAKRAHCYELCQVECGAGPFSFFLS